MPLFYPGFLFKTLGFFPFRRQCLVKSHFALEGDKCIRNPSYCHQGLSFSIWEKVTYEEDVLNVHRVHRKKYIFSTGESPLFYRYGGRNVGAKAKTHGFTNVAHTTTLIDTATFYVCPENDPFPSKKKSAVTFGPNVGPIVVTQTQRRAASPYFLE